MSRAKWKRPSIDCKAVHLVKTSNKRTLIHRNNRIMPYFLGRTFKVHNGKSHIKLLISKEMVGHKFGEFVFTRLKCIFKNKKNRKKNKKKGSKK
jgi:small subunit ribosomal protein S19